MNTIARVILVAVLALGSGCARPDWIEQTLVTVDVIGVWEGSMSIANTSIEAKLQLEQQGAKVSGYFRKAGLGRGPRSCWMGPSTAPLAAMCSPSA